jgi:peptidoglycan/LPS O-acetylase OafA/YrhL
MAPKKRESGGGYLASLTGLRAFAALLVFAYHFYGRWALAGGVFPPFLGGGSIGVSIFFTLSGFLLTRTYAEKFERRELSFFGYWFRRFARIFPAYLFFLALTFLSDPGSDRSLVNLIAQATLTHAYFASTIWHGLGVSWSLTVEEAFYLLLPPVVLAMQAMLRVLGQVSNGSSGSPGFLRYPVLLGLIYALIWELGRALMRLEAPGGFLASGYMTFAHGIFGRFGEFAIGMTLAYWLRASPKARPEPWTRFAREAAFLFFFAVTAFLMPKISALREGAGVINERTVPLYWIQGLGTLALLWACARESIAARWIFGNRAVEYAGRISYCFYLLQEDGVASWVRRLCAAAHPALEFSFLANLTVFILLAALAYEGVEKSAQAFLLRLAASARWPGFRKPLPARL